VSFCTRWSTGSIEWYQVTQHARLSHCKAPADRIDAWASNVDGSQIALVSGSDCAYQAITNAGDSDDMQWPVMHVFRRQGGKIVHFWERLRIMSTRCGRIGISWTLRQRVGQTFLLRPKFQV